MLFPPYIYIPQDDPKIEDDTQFQYPQFQQLYPKYQNRLPDNYSFDQLQQQQQQQQIAQQIIQAQPLQPQLQHMPQHISQYIPQQPSQSQFQNQYSPMFHVSQQVQQAQSPHILAQIPRMPIPQPQIIPTAAQPPPSISLQGHLSMFNPSVQVQPTSGFYTQSQPAYFQSNYYQNSISHTNTSSSTNKFDKSETLSGSYFKPTKTKKNSKPRINKILDGSIITTTAKTSKRTMSISLNLWNPIRPSMVEISEEKIKNEFLKALNIKQKQQQYTQLNGFEIELFDIFINVTSKEFDIFHAQNIFRKIVPEISLYDETKMIINLLLCLSTVAAHNANSNFFDKNVSSNYYQMALLSIRYYLSDQGSSNLEQEERSGIINRCLISTLLLCSFEFISGSLDNTHIKGATSILTSILNRYNEKRKGIQITSSSLLQSSIFHSICFWVFYINDFISCYKLGISPASSIAEYWKPLDRPYFDYFENIPNRKSNAINDTINKDLTVWWLRRAFVDHSRVIEIKNGKFDVQSKSVFDAWNEVKILIDKFEINLPLNLKPTIYQPSTPTRVIPVIFFAEETNAVLTILYKLSRVSLYEILLDNAHSESGSQIHQELNKFPPNYTKKVIKDIFGIVKTYRTSISFWLTFIDPGRLSKYLVDDPECMKEIQSILS